MTKRLIMQLNLLFNIISSCQYPRTRLRAYCCFAATLFITASRYRASIFIMRRRNFPTRHIIIFIVNTINNIKYHQHISEYHGSCCRLRCIRSLILMCRISAKCLHGIMILLLPRSRSRAPYASPQ